MNITRVPKIEKPFDHNDPKGKYKKGDVGIYDKYVLEAKKKGNILEIETPLGFTYANPVKLFKSKKYIYRYYKQDKPMRLFILTPEYGNKEKFFPPVEEITQEDYKTSLKVHLAALKAALHK
jgi:hypothetical protein